MKKPDHTTIQDILGEIQEQPAWRAQADKEMDYCDGNQLDSAVLKALQEKGIPPAIENNIGPAVKDILGMEAKNRTDWRVQPDGESTDEEADDVAKALNFKLNQAEKRSGADRACSDAYASLVKVGLGWVEVERSIHPFQYPYRCNFVHRNEVYWDFLAKQPDLSDARWILRRKWTDVDTAALMFPKHRELLKRAGRGWQGNEDIPLADDGTSTDLWQSWDIERGWPVEEQEWRDLSSRRVCIYQLLTTEWEAGLILRMPNGRVVEFRKEDPMHQVAVQQGYRVEKATFPKIYKHFFFGPHHLHTEQSEFGKYNLVPFFGEREDRTRIPYGVIRGLMYLQDEINARISKMHWLINSRRTIRTRGAVDMPDELFRQMVARPDADIILNDEHFQANQGAKFEIQDGGDLNAQQYQRLLDLREAFRRISGVSEAFSGDGGPDTASGLSSMIEQTVQSLADMNDNYEFARKLVGDLLLTLIIKDIDKQPQEVRVKAGLTKGERIIVLNQPTTDEETGETYLTNDVQRTKTMVTLEEVPSTPSFRQQQLSALSEFAKSVPEQYQAVMVPHLMNLANVPDKEDIIESILEINRNGNITEEDVQKRIDEAVKQAKAEWMFELKKEELAIKGRKTDAEIEKIISETVNKAIESIYSATQAAGQISTMPQIASSADQVLKSAGFKDKDAAPIVAGVEQPTMPAEQPRQNTSPMFPPRVQEPDLVETEEPAAEDFQPGPDAGLNEGIEAQGVQ